MSNGIPAPAQQELARTLSAVEEAISNRDEAQHVLAVFDMAIADAARQMELDEDAFRTDVRAIIRNALGSTNDCLLDRIKSRVRTLFKKRGAPIGPDPRLQEILLQESTGARLALVARVEVAERALEQATLEHDRVRLDVLAGGIDELLTRLAPLVTGRAELLRQRKKQTDAGELLPAVPWMDGEVSKELARLAAEVAWVNGQAWGDARFAQSRERLAALGYEIQTAIEEETAA